MIEEIKKSLILLYETFRENRGKIFRYSFITYLCLPIIKWLLLALVYIIKRTPESLDNFTKVTFLDNLLIWWLNVFIDPIKEIGIFIALLLVITIILAVNKEE